MFSRFFVERPIFAVVVALLIVIGGLLSLTQLPVQQYPSITPVQVTVQATYPGADAKTLADSGAAPIEAQINGVDNMLYVSSTSSATGQLLLTVFFSLDTDPDIAQVQVQNRVNLALPQLPSAVTQLGVPVQKKSATIMCCSPSPARAIATARPTSLLRPALIQTPRPKLFEVETMAESHAATGRVIPAATWDEGPTEAAAAATAKALRGRTTVNLFSCRDQGDTWPVEFLVMRR